MRIEIDTLPPEIARLIEQARHESVELTRDGKGIATLLVHNDDHSAAFSRAQEIVTEYSNDAAATRELRKEFPMGLREALQLIRRARALVRS